MMLGIASAFGAVLAGLGAGVFPVTLLGWPMQFPVDWMVVGVLASVVSGLYPAWRAARVGPTEALHRE
jgi:putative ABC transport system permease protein